MIRCLCLLVLGLAAPLATAGDLYKCSGPNREVAIQSDPCPKEWTQVWKRDAAPELPPSDDQLRALQDRRERELAEAEAMSRLAGTARLESVDKPRAKPKQPKASEPEPPQHDCRKAHAFADALREKAFLELSNYQLSRLSEWVAEQCREP